MKTLTRLSILFSTFAVAFMVTASSTLAVTLNTVGSSSTTTGNPGSEWYYTSSNPVLTGTSTASSTVTITIDGTAFTTTANASGSWTYTPTTLTTGDHTVTIADTTSTLSFTLHIGQTVPSGTTTSSAPKGGASGSAQTLPVSGSLANTLLLLGVGAGMIFMGTRLRFADNKI